jgi:hypothetical protein
MIRMAPALRWPRSFSQRWLRSRSELAVRRRQHFRVASVQVADARLGSMLLVKEGPRIDSAPGCLAACARDALGLRFEARTDAIAPPYDQLPSLAALDQGSARRRQRSAFGLESPGRRASAQVGLGVAVGSQGCPAPTLIRI